MVASTPAITAEVSKPEYHEVQTRSVITATDPLLKAQWRA